MTDSMKYTTVAHASIAASVLATVVVDVVEVASEDAAVTGETSAVVDGVAVVDRVVLHVVTNWVAEEHSHIPNGNGSKRMGQWALASIFYRRISPSMALAFTSHHITDVV